MSPARYVTPDPDDDGYDEDVPADPPPPAADDDAAPDDEPVVGDADGGGGGGSMGKARRWAKNLPDPSCCPALPLLLLALIGTVAFSFSRPPAALLQCGPDAIAVTRSIEAGAATRPGDGWFGSWGRHTHTDTMHCVPKEHSPEAAEAATRSHKLGLEAAEAAAAAQQQLVDSLGAVSERLAHSGVSSDISFTDGRLTFKTTLASSGAAPRLGECRPVRDPADVTALGDALACVRRHRKLPAAKRLETAAILVLVDSTPGDDLLSSVDWPAAGFEFLTLAEKSDDVLAREVQALLR
mmetsp:Transcript_28710/g.86929  ORF Transcript_28710/g.86929 Transcript_28710/m.86929 type:complete len:296 (-) Transcript_28710:274-1161(-)